MNVLVTGANGQLGRCLQDIAGQDETINMVFMDSHALDITKATSVNKAFASIDFDYCVNCAAYTAVDKAEDEKALAFQINAEALNLLAKACRDKNVILIHISTDFVFDGLKTNPYTEADPPNPINVYGLSKLKGEKYIQELLQQYFIIRTSWLYSEYGHNFVKTILRLGKEKNELRIVSDQIGAPTYSGDLARFILFLIGSRSNQYGIYHYSNKGAISWYDFARAIVEEAELRVNILPINAADFGAIAKRPAYSVMKLERAKKVFGAPIMNWRESLRVCINKLDT